MTDDPNTGTLVPALETKTLNHLLLLLGPSWLHQTVTDSILAEVWQLDKKTERAWGGGESTWFPQVISQELLIPSAGQSPWWPTALLSHKPLPYWSPLLGTQLIQVHVQPGWHLGQAAASFLSFHSIWYTLFFFFNSWRSSINLPLIFVFAFGVISDYLFPKSRRFTSMFSCWFSIL